MDNSQISKTLLLGRVASEHINNQEDSVDHFLACPAIAFMDSRSPEPAINVARGGIIWQGNVRVQFLWLQNSKFFRLCL